MQCTPSCGNCNENAFILVQSSTYIQLHLIFFKLTNKSPCTSLSETKNEMHIFMQSLVCQNLKHIKKYDFDVSCLTRG